MSGVVVQAQEGDIRAFEQLVAQWQGTVCGLGLGILGDVHASEDVAQEVFTTAWRKIGGLKNPASFGPWIRQMTRNKALSYRRSTVRRRRRIHNDNDAVAAAGVPQEGGLSPEDEQLLWDALETLPDGCRDVLILYYREGRSVRQVAQQLELSESAVKKRLSRARAALKAEVFEALGEVVTATAPGAALTALIVSSLAPTQAVAGSLAAKTVAKGAGLGAMLPGVVVMLGIFLGYTLSERLVPLERRGDYRRARNLSVGSLAVCLAASLFGRLGMQIGLVGFVATLGYVQFAILPKVFAPAPGSDPRQLRGARVGAVCGAIGWAVGAAFGLWGAFS